MGQADDPPQPRGRVLRDGAQSEEGGPLVRCGLVAVDVG